MKLLLTNMFGSLSSNLASVKITLIYLTSIGCVNLVTPVLRAGVYNLLLTKNSHIFQLVC